VRRSVPEEGGSCSRRMPRSFICGGVRDRRRQPVAGLPTTIAATSPSIESICRTGHRCFGCGNV
jgi:hypothetical protein